MLNIIKAKTPHIDISILIQESYFQFAYIAVQFSHHFMLHICLRVSSSGL